MSMSPGKNISSDFDLHEAHDLEMRKLRYEMDRVIHDDAFIGDDGVVDPADLDDLFNDGLGG